MGQVNDLASAVGTGLGVLRVIAADAPKPLAAAANDFEGMPAGALLGGDHVYTVRDSVTSIGRGLNNAVVLLDPSVSREHARLLHNHGAWIIENVSAHNPVWLDDRELGPRISASLTSGQIVRMGHTTLQFLAPSAPLGSTGPDASSGTTSTGDLRLLDPGVTIQFALANRLPPRARWAVVAMALLLFIAGALVTLGTATLVGKNALAAHGLGTVLAALTIPLVPALGAALLVALLDRYEREPIIVLIGTFLWGALIAIPAALGLERALSVWLLTQARESAFGASATGVLLSSAAQGLSAGLTEECVKGAGLLLLLLVLRDEFDNVTDGIIYGILIGAGFGMVENFVYFAGSARGDLGFLILGRVILGWLGHSTFTALFGAGLGLARETRAGRRKLLAPIIGFAAAVLLHSLFDFVDFQANAAVHGTQPGSGIATGAFIAVMANYLPLFAAQAVLLRMAMRALDREAAIIREFLAAEVAAAVVTPDEYAVLQRASLRARVEHHYFFVWGPRAYLAARALHQTVIGLAFRKWHVALGDHPKNTPRQPEDIYRERIARLRRLLARRVDSRAAVLARGVGRAMRPRRAMTPRRASGSPDRSPSSPR